MKKHINILIVVLLLLGCAKDNNTLDDITRYGGFVTFGEMPETSFNILRLDTEMLSATLSDPNNNAAKYTLTAEYEGSSAVVAEVSSFPSDLQVTIADVIAALGLSPDAISLSSSISFVGSVTTGDGVVYNGMSPAYDSNNVNNGGDTTDRMLDYFPNQAMEFNIFFYQPVGKKIRGTSFEEVAIAASEDAVYTRNGGADETADLLNGSGPPYVDYTAAGTGADDEIGFDSEYVAITDISTSSLGFSAERIGVYALQEDYDAYPDGTQGYHVEDPDGAIKITFDTVEVPEGQENSGISFQVFAGQTSWEELDGIHAYANITTDTGSEVLELISLYGDEMNAIHGKWHEVNSGYKKGVRSYQLVIQVQSGATPESFDLDHILVYESED